MEKRGRGSVCVKSESDVTVSSKSESDATVSLKSESDETISPKSTSQSDVAVSQENSSNIERSQESLSHIKSSQIKSSNSEASAEKLSKLRISQNHLSNLKPDQVKPIHVQSISKVKVDKCSGCGENRDWGCGDLKIDQVKLFEHVHASGKPNFQCCRIPVCQSSLNVSVWREKLHGYSDIAVCDLLQFGFPLDFDRSRTVRSSAGRNHKGARDYPQFIEKYFKKECTAKRIAGPYSANPLSVELIVSPLNSVPKDNVDERRVIVDLSWPAGFSVNDGISKDIYLGEVIALHYASVEQICSMINEIGPGAMIYKRDLRHAYRQISVDPRDYCFLGYHWEDSYYFDTVLAMGQRNAAMACARTTDAVIHMHHENGHKASSNYLDDLIGVSPPCEGEDAYNDLGQLLLELGLLENFAKACPPATVQLVLGILINTVDGTMSVPEGRMKEIISLVSEWQGKVKSSKIELQSLIGKLQYITKCVQQSRVFLNRLLETLRSMKGKKNIKLSESFQKDLKWWSMFVEKYNGVSFLPSSIWSEPDVTFATDSCLVGCGGFNSVEYFHSRFPKDIEDQQLPIHCLEMLTVLLAVRLWGSCLQSLKVQIYCDNESAVKVINSGKTKDPFLASCIREIWLEVSKYDFQLRAVHLPGEENRVPDWLSRWDCGQKYRDLFYGFIGDEPDKFTEILIKPELFKFSGEL